MQYTNLAGQTVEGEFWSDGPQANTVWVIPADGTDPVVVSVARNQRKQIHYTAPHSLPDVAPEIVAAADEVLERYREVQRLFAELGATPIGDEHRMAVAIRKVHDAAQQSRLPFINSHGGNRAIGDKRFGEISGE